MFGETAEVVYYDYNPKALELWQKIVFEWDGNDLGSFIGENVQGMDKVIGMFENEDAFKQSWKKFKKTIPKFMQCDIIRDPSNLLNALSPDGNYVWYSNVFKYFESIRCYGWNGVERKEQEFLRLLPEDTITVGYKSTPMKTNS